MPLLLRDRVSKSSQGVERPRGASIDCRMSPRMLLPSTADHCGPKAYRPTWSPRLVFRTPNLWCAVTESHRKPLTILCARPSLDPTDCARVRKMSLDDY